MMESSRYAPPKTDLGSEGTTGSQSWGTLETPATVWIKRVAAGGLAAGFFLPLTSCSGHDYSAATAYDWPSVGCCAAILLFFWPLACEIALSFVTRSRPELGNPWPRVVLMACTLLGITWLVYWGSHTRYGAIVAYVACAGYAIGLGVLIRRKLSGAMRSNEHV